MQEQSRSNLLDVLRQRRGRVAGFLALVAITAGGTGALVGAGSSKAEKKPVITVVKGQDPKPNPLIPYSRDHEKSVEAWMAAHPDVQEVDVTELSVHPDAAAKEIPGYSGESQGTIIRADGSKVDVHGSSEGFFSTAAGAHASHPPAEAEASVRQYDVQADELTDMLSSYGS